MILRQRFLATARFFRPVLRRVAITAVLILALPPVSPLAAEESETLDYACDVTDADTGEPVAGASVTWRIEYAGSGQSERKTWQQAFASDAAGRYQVGLPQGVRGTVWLEVRHDDYLPIRGSGYPFFLPGADAGIQPDHRHIRMKRGVEVTGRFLLPDGSPAQDLIVMVGRDRDGFGDGDGRCLYARTGSDGRFRLVTRGGWPQRLHWLPEKHQCDSRALVKTTDAEGSLQFGDQGTIRLKPGPRLTGRIVDREGRGLEGLIVRAESGTRIPWRYATSDAEGRFQFAPLPPGEYWLTPVRNYKDDARDGQWTRAILPVPIPAVKHVLAASGDSGVALLQAPETISIRVRVVDAAGQPLGGRHLAIGQLSDFVNALLAEPVPGAEGLYEFRFPKGAYIRDLSLRHPWSEAAFYQESPQGPKVPGAAIVLGKADRDVEGITIHVRRAGKIRVRVRKGDTGEFLKDYSVSFDYAADEARRDSRVMSGRLVILIPAQDPTVRELEGIAPETPGEIVVAAPGYVTETRTIQLEDGQTRTLEIALRPAEAK